MAWADSSLRDRRTTSCPVVAATSAIPAPMIPEPTIPTRAIPMCGPPDDAPCHWRAVILPTGSFRRQWPRWLRTCRNPERSEPTGESVAGAGRSTSVTAVVSTPPVVVERPRRFPALVEAELDRRRMHLLERARGRVLDLDRPEARAEIARASIERHVVPAYDSAVSVAQLVRFPDLAAALRGIDRLLALDGELLVVEPTLAARPRPPCSSIRCGPGRAGSTASTSPATSPPPCVPPPSCSTTSRGSPCRPPSPRCAARWRSTPSGSVVPQLQRQHLAGGGDRERTARPRRRRRVRPGL